MTRRFVIALCASLALLASACSDETDSGSADQNLSAADTDTTTSDEGDRATPRPSGRLELGGDSYNFWLGDMTTAMCDVGDSVLIEDMRTSDGIRVSAIVSSGTSEITLRDPDGNRMWITGNSGEAEGVTVNIQTVDNVLMVDGTWVDPSNPDTTEDGNLVITC
ncbi:MAG TPA: hypothetical protein VFN03_12590 [Trueperaceae bacterium]|nr:hypothetical protein [Trueperaceae bacterium]